MLNRLLIAASTLGAGLLSLAPVHADPPLLDQPGNYMPPPSYSRWIYWTPQLYRLRVEHHMPPLQQNHFDPPTPAPTRVFCYPKPPVPPGALFHPSSIPFERGGTVIVPQP